MDSELKHSRKPPERPETEPSGVSCEGALAPSIKLINLLDTHIAETRAKFPDDPPYTGLPDYEEDGDENS